MLNHHSEILNNKIKLAAFIISCLNKKNCLVIIVLNSFVLSQLCHTQLLLHAVLCMLLYLRNFLTLPIFLLRSLPILLTPFTLLSNTISSYTHSFFLRGHTIPFWTIPFHTILKRAFEDTRAGLYWFYFNCILMPL